MSKKIKERTKELASREKAIKKKLLGQTSDAKSKGNRIAKTALVGGGIALGVYFIYKAFIQDDDSKPEKKKKEISASGVVAEKLMTFILPYLGKLLERLLNKVKGEKKEVVSSSEEEN